MNLERNKWAIFTGRFQPFHLGHLDFIKLIGKEVSPQIIIAVAFRLEGEEIFCSHLKKRKHPFVAKAEKKHLQRNNPFSFWEVYEMISQSCKPLRKKLQIVVLPYLRPQIWWPLSASWFPPKRTWVFCDLEEEYERLKIDFYRSLLTDSIILLKPRFIIHNSEIRERVFTKEELKEYFPSETIEVLRKIGGFERLGIKIKR